MKVPPGLREGSVEWRVSERGHFFDESLRFGPYSIEDVNRGWTSVTAVGLMNLEKANADQKFEFRIRNSSGMSRSVQCLAAAGWTRADFDHFLSERGSLSWEIGSEKSLACVAAGSGRPGSGRLVLVDSHMDSMPVGSAVFDGRRMEIRGSRSLENGAWQSMEVTGYVLVLDGREIAAVDVMNDGVVRIRNGLDDKVLDAVSVTAASLLLYRELKR